MFSLSDAVLHGLHLREFLKMAWMKEDKQLKAPDILLITRRFNEVKQH